MEIYSKVIKNIFFLYMQGAFYSFFGANLLFAVILIFKKFGFNTKMFIIAVPFILINQFIFNYIYSSVYPSIIKGWLITTVIVSGTVFLYSVLFLGESFTLKHIFASCFILAGVFLLR